MPIRARAVAIAIPDAEDEPGESGQKYDAEMSPPRFSIGPAKEDKNDKR
jgi:hypothetical protein